MRFGREINRLWIGMILAFAFIGFAAAFWAITGADSILQRQDNPRRVEAESAIQRGTIYDRSERPLAESVPGTGELLTRQYLNPAAYSALGYSSQRYGVGGVEAVYNSILRGDDLAAARNTWDVISDGLLHRVQVGSDIRLTLDLDVQMALAEAMNGYQGAAVVIGVPDGDTLAMVSLPTFDPNTLDTNWDALSVDPGRPFFNRALQARYQPGATTETILMAAALLTGEPLDAPIQNATRPIRLDDLTLNCAVPLGDTPLTLRDAYAFACPAPFADLAQRLDLARVQGIFDTFRVGDAPTLPGFDAIPTSPEATPENFPDDGTISADELLSTALGQGERTVTPLEMAMIAAGIVNDGNAPQPYLLDALRRPENPQWIEDDMRRPTIPIAISATARGIQDLMREAVSFGVSSSAARPDLDIGGHVGLAYTGEETLAWFVGFVTVGADRAAAVAVVLENSADLGLAADIGGTALNAARDTLSAAIP